MFTTIRNILLATTVVLLLAGCVSVRDSQLKAEVVTARGLTSQATVEPKNIVLMLPLKGELVESSQAIRNGFLAAYYYSQKQRPSIKIKVVDTAGGDVQALYKQAAADGAEVIVGPLTKKEVGVLMNIKPLPVPTIALNTLDDYNHNFAPDLYQFGLSPQDEATQVATKMMQQHHDRVAIIAPENAWGKKIVAAFNAMYVSSGGQIIATLNYKSAQNLAEQICFFLAEDATKLCVPRKHKNKNQIPEEETTRRKDINTIFLVANVAEARQIVPLLKFYYAGDLPIYATSAVYRGAPAPNLDRDIDNVYFCDMPWVLKEPDALNSDLQTIQRQIIALWADSFPNYKRLYALGVDAFNLASGLSGLLNSPQSGIDGASGTLYLDDYNHIYRKLQWAVMRDGITTLLN